MPLVGAVSEIQDALLVALQLHEDAALTDIEALLVPDAGKNRSVGVTLTEQAAGGAETLGCCVILTV